MENASKALIIAGSVLMAMLIIGALVFMYSQITGIEQTKTDNDELSKITEYSQRFEQYNKTIYGSELLSLANLQDDYEKTQVKQHGYTKINIKVQIKNTMTFGQGNKVFTLAAKEYDLKQEGSQEGIFEIISNVENAINDYENENVKINKTNKTIKYYSQLSIRELAKVCEVEYLSDDGTDVIEEKIREVSRNLLEKIYEYKMLKSDYNTFKNKRFKCTEMKYDLNGRVNYMLFVEK